MIAIYACAPDESEKRDLAIDVTAHWMARKNTRGGMPSKVVFKDDIQNFPDVLILSQTQVSLPCELGKCPYQN